MKRIDELGISPWPWEETSLCRVTDCNGDFVANSNNPFITRLIAAAPELYEALMFINEHIAIGDFGCSTGGQGVCDEANEKMRKALAKASGESEAK